MEGLHAVILALETSCDETSAAVLEGHRILSNIVASQIDMHRQWGGVVPEAAARAHIEAVLPVIQQALDEAKIPMTAIRRIAVTNRPGLVGALSVGVTVAAMLAEFHRLPLTLVHHLEGHLSSVLDAGEPIFPMITLIASGGHTEIVLVRRWGDYEIVGETRDDAAGEAFDKSARVLGLGYPGGIAIQRAAVTGTSGTYALPRGLKGDTTEFSFSGLKTAVMRLSETHGAALDVPSAALAVQDAIAGVLAERTILAAERFTARSVGLVGGVAANVALRDRLQDECARRGLPFLAPRLSLCTDNAAMIGLAASLREPITESPTVLSSAPLPAWVGGAKALA